MCLSPRRLRGEMPMLCRCCHDTTTPRRATHRRPLPHAADRACADRIWNATVANLTLMALGSSAPEILLSIVEVLAEGFNSGELGPATIVGSAAFNLCAATP